MYSPCKLLCIVFMSLLSWGTMAQSVSYSPLFDNSTFDRSAIDLTSRPVGAVDGATGTSPSGAVTYTIPIKVPAGTNGMTPNISLVYNSQSGDGILGLGWNIAGLSAISRAGKDFYHDGKVAPVTYTNNDAFMLDGSRLALTSGTYGEDLATYRTEMESYAVITSYGAGSPQYFNVVSKDGTIMQYGNSGDSRIKSDDNSKVMMWRLNKIRDINGNTIWFTYDNTDRDSRIKEIKYTGNEFTGLAYYFVMTFNYQLRDDKNTGYDGTYTRRSHYLLTSIDIHEIATAEKFKTYSLWYGKNKEQSYLKLITEYNADGDNLNDTRFKYGEQTSDEAINNYPGMLGSYPTEDDFVSPADFDGDGIDDLLVSKKSWDHTASETWTSSFVIKKRTSTSTAYTTTCSLSFSSSSFVLENDKFMNSSYLGSTADFNGDGRSDLMVSYSANSLPPRELYNIKLYYANSSGTISSTPSYTYYPAHFYNVIHEGPDDQQNYLYVGDFNGDGISDFITILGGQLFFNSPEIGVVNKMVNDYSISSGAYPAVAPYFVNADGVYVVNMDGDAKSDLLLIENGISRVFTLDFDIIPFYLHVRQIGTDMNYPNDSHEILLGDFNGDGKTDILTGPKKKREIHTKDWTIGYSSGGSFRPYSLTFDHAIKLYTSAAGGTITDRLCIGDFNGDGKSDIYDYYMPAGEHHIYYSYGHNANSPASNFFLKKKSTSISGVAENIVVGDFNGDGQSDLFANKSVQIVSFNAFDHSKWIEEINDGYNRTTTFTYEPLTKGTGTGTGDFYTKGSGESYPVNNGQYPFYVATSMTTPNGAGGSKTVNFKYHNLRLHRTKGLLGFEKVVAIDPLNDLRNESFFVVNTDYYVPYLLNTKTFLNSTGVQLSQNNNTYTFSPKSGSSYLYKQELTGTLVQDFLKSVNTATENTFDAYGNITLSTATTTGGETFTSSVATTYAATGGAPIPNRPTEIVRTSQRGSLPSVSSKITNTYDSRGNVLKFREDTEPYIPKYNRVKEFTYDNYGNVIHTVQRMAFVSPTLFPTYTYEYDSKGRFVVKEINETNGLGDFKTTTVHKFWGTPLSVTGYNGLTTSYTYDNWGKLKTTTIPTGTSTSYTVNYSDAWDLGTNQLYYTLVQDPSAPNVKTWYDNFGRTVKTQQETFGSAWTTATTSYNDKGNVAASTNHYLPSESPITTTFNYDYLNRIASSTNVYGTTSYSYSTGAGLATTTTTLPDGKVKKTTVDAMGKVIKSSNGIAGTVHYSYDSRGNETRTSLGTEGMAYQALILKEYDEVGRLKKMKDEDAGTTTYEYNLLGQLSKQTDPAGKATLFTYDFLGRLTRKTLDAYTTTYTYFDRTQDYQLWQMSVSSPEGTFIDEYTYETGKGMTSHLKNINGTEYAKNFSYDSYNRLLGTDYPIVMGTAFTGSGLSLRNHYDANGFLTRITTNFTGTPASEKTLYEITAMNGNGQVTNFKRADGLSATITYDNAFPTDYQTTGVQDLHTNYNLQNGNVVSRTDYLPYSPVSESFTYDAVDRLTHSLSGGAAGAAGPIINPPIDVTYNNAFWGSFGQISSKSDVGAYGYGGFPRNAVKSVTDPAGMISHATQDVVYNAFHKTQKITETIGGLAYEENFLYDAGEDRAYSEQKQAGAISRQRWYMGEYERQKTGTNDCYLHYLYSDEGMVGIVKAEGGSFSYYSVYTDHLGSILKVTDEMGTVVAEQNFGPWGSERDTWTWGPGTSPRPYWLYRGYTGHEMLPEYGLINMNGRMYDPLNGRMLRPDNFVTYPDNSQSYNRYSYAMNNPLKYTDPDGNNMMVAASIIGGFMGGAMYALGNRDEKWDWGKFMYAVGAGAIFGLMGNGIGSAFAPAAKSTGALILKEAVKAGAHGASGYISSGGNMNSFYSGAFGSAAGSIAGNMPGSVGAALNTNVGGTAFAALSGGIGSRIGGGNFWQGAALGATIHLVNQVSHKLLQDELQSVFDNYPMESDGAGGYRDISAAEAFKSVSPAAYDEYVKGNYENACATRLSIAFAKAGVKLPSGYGGIKDINGNRIIMSASQMNRFMSNRYGAFMSRPSMSQLQSRTLSGIYIMTTEPGRSWSGHVSKVAPNFKTDWHFDALGSYSFWGIK